MPTDPASVSDGRAAGNEPPSAGSGAPTRGFFGLVVGRPVAITMLVLGVLVFGGVSWNLLPLNLLPDVSYPTLTVRTEVPGAAPEEIERNVTRPIEQAVGVVSGLVASNSVSRAGLSDVVLEFDWAMDMNAASQEVREKLEFVGLPQDANRPVLLRYDPSLDPVLQLALAHGEADVDPEAALAAELELRRLAESELERQLLTLPGVAAVRVRGGLQPQVRVELDEARLTRLGLSIADVSSRIGQENVNVAGGLIEDGDADYLVRILNEFGSIDEVEGLIVGRAGGRPVRLSDIGTVTLAHAEQEVRTRAGGQPCVIVDVFREADANIVSISEAVRTALYGAPQADALPPPAEEGEKTGSGGNAASDEDGEAASTPGQRPTTLAGALPDGVSIAVISDQAGFIRLSIREVVAAALWGGLFAALVLYLFLRNVAQTLVVCLSIPLSVVATFAPLHLFGVSLNLMSLGGLALGIGMLVDNGIVVIESVFRCREEGDPPLAAAIRGAREVGGAVTASTLTTIAVFLPIVFVTGIAGQVFGDLALSVVFSLAMSLAVALTFVPMLAARVAGGSAPSAERAGTFRAWRWPDWTSLAAWRRRRRTTVGTVLAGIAVVALAPADLLGLVFRALFVGTALLLTGVGVALGRVLRGLLRAADATVGRAFAAAFGGIDAAYPSIVRGALRLRGVVVALGLVLLVGALRLGAQLPRELIPRVHQGRVLVEASLPVGTPLARTDEVARVLERRLLALPHVEQVGTTVGTERTAATDSDKGEHSIGFTILVDAGAEPAIRERAVTAGVRRVLASVPNLAAEVRPPALFSRQSPIEVQLLGDDLDALRDEATAVAGALAELPGITDVHASVREGSPEVRIVYDRERLASLGLRVQDVAQVVRAKVRGSVPTRFRGERQRIDVLVRLSERDRQTVRDLERLVVNPGAGTPVRLASVADVEVGAGPAEIRHVDGTRAAIVAADHQGIPLSLAVQRVRRSLAATVTDPSITHAVAGQQAEVERSQASLLLALALAVFLVYIVMASQFESVLQPLIILVSVPLAGAGAVLALRATGTPVSVVVFLGLIVLVGIVVNNAIVLVDRGNQLRRRGLPRREAIARAAAQRLRPILMTTLTTVLGLLPLALAGGQGAEIRAPLALVVIGGLLSSTLLTLVVVPACYDLLESGLDWVRGRPEPTSSDAPRAGVGLAGASR